MYYDGGLQNSATNTTSIDSTTYSSNPTPGYVGAYKASDASYHTFNGRIAFPFYYIGVVSDAELLEMFTVSRRIFGV